MREPTGPPSHQRRNHYHLGLGLGLIPLLFLLLGVGFAVNTTNGGVTTILVATGGAFAAVAVIGMIVCLAINRVRFVGYERLTITLASFIIARISCVSALQHTQR